MDIRLFFYGDGKESSRTLQLSNTYADEFCVSFLTDKEDKKDDAHTELGRSVRGDDLLAFFKAGAAFVEEVQRQRKSPAGGGTA